jgi:quinol monooxygenase YgiN
MDAGQLVILATSALAAFAGPANAGDRRQPYVRVADIEISPTQIEVYKAAMKEQVEDAVQLESGVLALYAVADAEDSTHVTVLEIYADVGAYKAHLETAHFRKYKTVTQDMVKSLKLRDTVPVALAAKTKPMGP